MRKYQQDSQNLVVPTILVCAVVQADVDDTVDYDHRARLDAHSNDFVVRGDVMCAQGLADMHLVAQEAADNQSCKNQIDEWSHGYCKGGWSLQSCYSG